ncbi:NeuA CMP-N-acetylneuraminic acid synthetase [Burkholderiaceae bacterium]
MILSIIPARKGSKGILRKNLALLGGKPLVQHTISAALESNLVDEILLSTDDEEVTLLGCKLGLKNEYIRPQEISADSTGMIDTVLHAVSWFEEVRGYLPDQILLLQPTSPLRTQVDIDSAITLFKSENANSLVSVHPMREHPYECILKEDQRKWSFLAESHSKVFRRQDYQQNYQFINGAIYLVDTKKLIEKRALVFPGESLLYEMPFSRGVDIDTAFDLKTAELILSNQELLDDI